MQAEKPHYLPNFQLLGSCTHSLPDEGQIWHERVDHDDVLYHANFRPPTGGPKIANIAIIKGPSTHPLTNQSEIWYARVTHGLRFKR